MVLRYQLVAVFKMYMKKILYPIACGLMILTACDKVSEGEFLDKNGNLGKGYVLIEDYTGQSCGQCPAASDIAEELHEANPEQVIVMEVHAGFFAKPKTSGDKYLTDYRTPESEELNTFFGNEAAGNPNGLINRIGYPTNEQVKTMDKWGQFVASEMNKESTADIKSTVSFDTTSRKANLITEIKFKIPYDPATNIIVYLTEDSIADWQKDYRFPSGEEDRAGFYHRHVLRTSLNSAFGSPLTTEPVLDGSSFKKSFSYDLPANFVAKNCRFVILLTNSLTKEVLEVRAKYLIEPASEN